MRWKDDPHRAALLALYARADELVAGAECACTPGSAFAGAPERDAAGGPDGDARTSGIAPCCHFALTGREPYPTAVEVAEVLSAVRATGQRKRPGGRKLPVLSDLRRCPLLSDEGRCSIYASRPLGCRTFFCDRGEGPPKKARAGLLEIARRVADLSAKAFPRDPLPRPLVSALKDAV